MDIRRNKREDAWQICNHSAHTENIFRGVRAVTQALDPKERYCKALLCRGDALVVSGWTWQKG